MARVYVSSVINGRSDRVWARVRDFNGLPSWHPGIAESRIENGEPSDKIGCVRDFACATATASAKSCSGCRISICSALTRSWNRRWASRIMWRRFGSRPITDGERTFVEWTAEFDCPPERESRTGHKYRRRRLSGRIRCPQTSVRRLMPMIRIVRSTIIDAPTDRVWALLRDFNGHDQWHPAVGKSAIERGQSCDKIGCVRQFFPARRLGAARATADAVGSGAELSAIVCWIRRFRCSTTSPMCGWRRSPMATAHSGTGVAHFRPARARKRRWRAWSAKIYTMPVSRRSAPVSPPRPDWRVAREHHCQNLPPSGRGRRRAVERTRAHFLGGGTLVMRAVNEADPDDRRPSCARPIRASSAYRRVFRPDRAGRRRDHGGDTRRARTGFSASGGARGRRPGGARGCDCRRQPVCADSPYGDFAAALLALDATVDLAGGFGQREQPLEEFLSRRERGRPSW